MSIVGLDHIVVNTKDVDRAIGFYQDILGTEGPGHRTRAFCSVIGNRTCAVARLP
jgi:catechol 2,3-dioxygenase-like lactoylglutathione lyase family enzyme